ncbi:L,D-transpeptidase [Bacillus sp. 165]|nr:L,D-transpeptidase [Bacillus sp. 165]
MSDRVYEVQLVSTSGYTLQQKTFDIDGLWEAFAPTPRTILILNRGMNRLAFFEEGHLVKEFEVATGKRSMPTPEGEFPIVNKLQNRPYYKKKIPGGDPTNPLGTRWLGLKVPGVRGVVYAIHGNRNPRSIGKYVSAGCVRMYNKDIEWLFEKVDINTPVIIQNFSEDYYEIAGKYGYKVDQIAHSSTLQN